MITTLQNPKQDPLTSYLAAPDGGVLAIIAGVEGPSYRPVGAIMTIFNEVERAGTLSSGCVESDIALHALEAREAGVPRMVRYGRGSPFVDIQLPCGGGLDILLLPDPDKDVLAKIVANREARRPCSLTIDIESGALTLGRDEETRRVDKSLTVRFQPDLRFLVFGKGPEASTFSALVHSAGYPSQLISPDLETLDAVAPTGCATRHMVSQSFPTDIQADDRTAIVLFFHDHEWEPPIMSGAVKTDAFYIGAQGSQRARDARMLVLESLGVSAEDRARLFGPIGLIRSARDAGTLAVSVLAEILDVAMHAETDRRALAPKTGRDDELLGTVGP